MKYEKITIPFIILILIIVLDMLKLIQITNIFSMIVLLTIIFVLSVVLIKGQKMIDKNHEVGVNNFANVDLLKYICSIIVIIAHIRPFINHSGSFDFIFNNLISRVCVPIFLVITGYFVSKKEMKDPKYVEKYLKNLISIYLVWSILYIPFVIGFAYDNQKAILDIIKILSIPRIVIYIFTPIILLLYTGVFYHLWYFPACICALILLKFLKRKFKIKTLLYISFVFLLIGATETYFGVLPSFIKNIMHYYFSVFFTTRNFLFFAFFYVVLGYYIGQKKHIYSKYCFYKMAFSLFLLVVEALLLYQTKRLNSNILLGSVPLAYYLFISCVYLDTKIKNPILLRNLSQYYYLIHPMVIFILSVTVKSIYNYPIINILVVVTFTHLLSILVLKLKHKYRIFEKL